MLYEYFIPFNDVFISSYSFKMFWELIGLLSNYHNNPHLCHVLPHQAHMVIHRCCTWTSHTHHTLHPSLSPHSIIQPSAPQNMQELASHLICATCTIHLTPCSIHHAHLHSHPRPHWHPSRPHPLNHLHSRSRHSTPHTHTPWTICICAPTTALLTTTPLPYLLTHSPVVMIAKQPN